MYVFSIGVRSPSSICVSINHGGPAGPPSRVWTRVAAVAAAAAAAATATMARRSLATLAVPLQADCYVVAVVAVVAVAAVAAAAIAVAVAARTAVDACAARRGRRMLAAAVGVVARLPMVRPAVGLYAIRSDFVFIKICIIPFIILYKK